MAVRELNWAISAHTRPTTALTTAAMRGSHGPDAGFRGAAAGLGELSAGAGAAGSPENELLENGPLPAKGELPDGCWAELGPEGRRSNGEVTRTSLS